MSEDVVIKSFFDTDFGALQLVETRTMAGVDGEPMRPLVYRTWRSVAGAPGPEILISEGDDPLNVSEDVRADYRRFSADIDALKAHVARAELELARDWAASGDLNLELTEASFAKMLVIDGYTIDPGRVTVWLSEPADIFAGHVIEVRIENGTIKEIGLAG